MADVTDIQAAWLRGSRAQLLKRIAGMRPFDCFDPVDTMVLTVGEVRFLCDLAERQVKGESYG